MLEIIFEFAIFIAAVWLGAMVFEEMLRRKRERLAKPVAWVVGIGSFYSLYLLLIGFPR